MGFNVARFPGKVDQSLICSICSSVLEDAVLTPCGHSFCNICLSRWLVRPGSLTCPECRGAVGPGEARPIHSIRSLINTMDIHCEHRSRGCDAVVKLDNLRTHLTTCPCQPVPCAGCGIVLNRTDLPQHHMACVAIAAAIGDESDLNKSPVVKSSSSLSNPPSPVPSMSELACRVASLELQLRRMRRDLDSAELRNQRLERELRHTKEDLQEKRSQLSHHSYVDFDPEYDYGYVSTSIAKLARLISRFLLRKPSYIDSENIFDAIKRCYDNFGRSPSDHGHSVHMLLATAYASNWFTEQEKLSLYCWLQALIRNREVLHPGGNLVTR